jgi:hypothetical protein
MSSRSRRVLNVDVVALVCSMIGRDLVEGIFRTSGSRTVVDQLLAAFVSKEALSEFCLSHPAVTSLELASALKRYLRDLRVPVLSDADYGRMAAAVAAVGEDVAAADVGPLCDVYAALENRRCLGVVLAMLAGIDHENVGTVFAPSLFPQTLPLDTLQTQARIVSVFVHRLQDIAGQRDTSTTDGAAAAAASASPSSLLGPVVAELPKRPARLAPVPPAAVSLLPADDDVGEEEEEKDIPGLRPVTKPRRPMSYIDGGGEQVLSRAAFIKGMKPTKHQATPAHTILGEERTAAAAVALPPPPS